MKIEKFRAIFKLLKKDSNYNSHTQNERERRIILTATTGTVAKILSMAIPLVTVRLTYNYLGAEMYGLWNAILSFFAIFQFADLGLGNGLQTKLSIAYGKEDITEQRRLISATFFVLCIVSFIILVTFAIAFPFINWSGLVNAKTSDATNLASMVVLIIVLSKIFTIPLSLVQRTQLALQEGYISNLWQIAGYFISLISVIVISLNMYGKLTLIVFSSFTTVFVLLLNLIFFFGKSKKNLSPSVKFLNKKIVKNIFSIGTAFFFLNILTTIGLSLDNFVVANVVSLSESGSFSILLKTTTMIGAVTTMLSAPLWAANGEAISRGELKWVRENSKKMSFVMTGISFLASLSLILFSHIIFRVLVGSDFEFSVFILVGMCLLQILLSFISPKFMILNAIGAVKFQIIIFLIYTPISFFLKFYLGSIYGAIAIPWVGAISYLIFIVFPTHIFVSRLLKKERIVLK